MEESSSLGFRPQKQVIYNKLLPYSERLDAEILEQIREIKENLCKAVILRDTRPGCVHWVARLSRFVKLYGICFSKEDHVKLVKLMYELAVIPNQEFWVMAKFAQMLRVLLKKKELLSPDDLVLEWRPLYDLYNSLFYNSYSTIGMLRIQLRTRRNASRMFSRRRGFTSNVEGAVENMIRICRFYFPPNATKEILEEVRPLLCPFDTIMRRAMVYLELFLPTTLNPDQEDIGWRLWRKEMLGIWTACHNGHSLMWENTLFLLFSRVAWDNIGYIDWEEHLPMVFTKVLRSFHLPVTYKTTHVGKGGGVSPYTSAIFIVANLGGNSKTQENLSRLLKSLESYYHPSNTGRWTMYLLEFLDKLSLFFIKRLHRERYKKPSWEVEVPAHKKLTEDDITAFVLAIQTPTMLTMYSEMDTHDAGIVFHRLSLLRPELVVPPLLERLYSALEASTEPQCLTASLVCVACVARALVRGGKHYPEGQRHVIPLLLQTLPGIDPNDLKKCMVTFQFISMLVMLVPFVDCSSAAEELADLTELEQEVCLQTAGFEDFVMQFMDRCFVLIENSTLEQITQQDRETEKMNQEENMLEMGLSSTFFAIMTQAHPKIYDAALQRLQTFIKGKMIEIHVAGKLAANMCRTAVRINPQKALKVFVPGVCRLLLTLTDNEEVQNEEHLDDELLFNLLLLSELVRCSGCHLLHYIPQITQVLSQTLHLKSREGYHLAGSLLRYLLKYLSTSMPSEYRSLPYSLDEPFSTCLPIRHWGEPGDVHNLGLAWVEPTEAEEAAIQTLVRTFLTPELMLLHKVATGEKEVSREQLQQSLSIALDILLGAGAALPHWEEDPISLVDMAVKEDTSKFIVRNRELCVTLDSEHFPTNVRKAAVDVILKLVDRLLTQGSDDTKSLCRAVNIYRGLIFFHGVSKEDFDSRWKTLQLMKNALANRLTRNKQHTRSHLIERAFLHQESRALENSVKHLTSTHSAIMSSLLKLSISQYSEVRIKSQQALNQVFQFFPYSYKLILPVLVTYLQVDPTEQHEQFKGSLFLLLGRAGKSLVVRRDWESLNMVWPALISSQHSEKPSIIMLMEAVCETVRFDMELFAIYHHIPEKVVEAAEALLHTDNPKVKDSVVTEAAVSSACENLLKKGKTNHELYTKLVMSLVEHLESGALHWRTHNMALNLLGCLIRPDVVFPAQGVRAFTSNLIHDNIRIREISIYYMSWILKNQKRKHKKVEIDPYSVCGKHDVPASISPGDHRPDNQWMQYSSKQRITSEEEWEQLRYVEKTFYGWYTWPKTMQVYAPPSQQPTLDRTRDMLKEEECELYDFFIVQENVDKLISFLSLEENKERESFESHRFWMIKGLFRNFGDTFLPMFVGHLERLVKETQRSSQRCAVEIITGIIRGSKHWTFSKHVALWEKLKPILKTGMGRITVETVEDWGTCMTTACADRDPNRLCPLMEVLMDNPLRASEGAFNGSSRLYMLISGLGQQQWRVSELCHQLLEYLRPSISHEYKSIRDRMGSVLAGIFMYDLVLPGGGNSQYPSCSKFIEEILPQLAPLIQEPNLSAANDSYPESTKYVPSVSFPHEGKSVSHSESKLFSDGVIPSMRDMRALSESGSFAKVLDSVQSENSDAPMISPLVSHVSGLESGNLLAGRDSKDLVRLGKIKIKENLDLSSDVLYSSVSIVQSDVVNFEKNSIHENHAKNQVNGYNGSSEERKVAVRLMNTVCHWLVGQIGRCISGVNPEIYRFLPYLCQLESVDNDLELRGNCLATLAVLSQALVLPSHIPAFITTITQIAQSSWWRARTAVLALLQVAMFNNMFTILSDARAPQQVQDLVVGLLSDSRLEVQQMASAVLSGLVHCKFIQAEDKLLNDFMGKLQKIHDQNLRRKKPLQPHEVTELHANVLGLCAYVSAFPYDVSDMLPQVLVTLSDHLNDPHPIPATIKKTLSNFRRTHYDNWRDHKQKFTEDQLVVLTDLLLSPSYYA